MLRMVRGMRRPYASAHPTAGLFPIPHHSLLRLRQSLHVHAGSGIEGVPDAVAGTGQVAVGHAFLAAQARWRSPHVPVHARRSRACPTGQLPNPSTGGQLRLDGVYPGEPLLRVAVPFRMPIAVQHVVPFPVSVVATARGYIEGGIIVLMIEVPAKGVGDNRASTQQLLRLEGRTGHLGFHRRLGVSHQHLEIL